MSELDPNRLEECPFCGEDLRASDGSVRLGSHLGNCPGRPEARRKLEERARKADREVLDRFDRMERML